MMGWLKAKWYGRFSRVRKVLGPAVRPAARASSFSRPNGASIVLRWPMSCGDESDVQRLTFKLQRFQYLAQLFLGREGQI